MIPAERLRERPKMTGPELKAAIAALGLHSNEIARRYRVDRNRVRRWMHGDQDVPPWLERIVLATQGLIAVRRLLERREARGMEDGAEIVAIGALLEMLVGKRYDPPPRSTLYTCPSCHKSSWNPNDGAHRFCGYCKTYDDGA